MYIYIYVQSVNVYSIYFHNYTLAFSGVDEIQIFWKLIRVQNTKLKFLRVSTNLKEKYLESLMVNHKKQQNHLGSTPNKNSMLRVPVPSKKTDTTIPPNFWKLGKSSAKYGKITGRNVSSPDYKYFLKQCKSPQFSMMKIISKNPILFLPFCHRWTSFVDNHEALLPRSRLSLWRWSTEK